MKKVYITEENGAITGIYDEIPTVKNILTDENGEEREEITVLPHVEKLLIPSAEAKRNSGADLGEFSVLGDFAVHTETYEREYAENASKREAARSETVKNAIRERRKTECFAVVDRALWLESLTTQQKNELKSWYEAWLDAPNTGVIPAKPEFLRCAK